MVGALGCCHHRCARHNHAPNIVDAGHVDAVSIEAAPVDGPVGGTAADAAPRAWRGADDHLPINLQYLDLLAGPGVACVDRAVRDPSVRGPGSPLGSVEHSWLIRRGCVSLNMLDELLRDKEPELVQCFEDADPGYYAAITIRTIWGEQDRRYDPPRFSRSVVLHARGRTSLDVNRVQDCLDGLFAKFNWLGWDYHELPAELDLALVRDLPPGREVLQPRPKPPLP